MEYSTEIKNGEKLSDLNADSRLIIIADALMDWSARLTILSARLLANYCGEIIMIGESMHPLFDKEMGVEFYSWNRATKNIHLNSPWGQFHKPQYKPFLINKFYKGTTLYLDSDIFCDKPFDEILNIDAKWGAVITRTDRNLISSEYLNLWNLKSAVNTQINSGVLVFRDQSIINEWCNIFQEASKDFKKYDYIMNKQPWTYDQIGLIIAAARMNLPPVRFDFKYNYEVAFHGWSNIDEAIIIHLTNWKVLNFAEALEMDKRWYGSKKFIKCAKKLESIYRKEIEVPPIAPLPNPIRSKRATSLVRSRYTSRKILLGLSQGIGNVIMGTPLIKALMNLGFSVDLLSGQFNNNSEQVVEKLGVNIVNINEAKKKSKSYAFGLQSIWPVKGIEELCGQVVYAGEILKYWDNYLFIHEVEANMAIAYSLGFQNEIPSLYCHREDKNPIQDIDKDKPLIGLHISKIYSHKFYANRALKFPERIAGLLDAVGCRVVLIGGVGSEPDLSVYPKGTIDLVGKLELAQTASVIKSLDAMINEDSGIMHVCAAMDTPQVAIFGPTSVVKNRPWNNKAFVLQSSLSCQPCQFTPMMDACQNNKCMDIDYEKAVGIVTRLLRNNENWKKVNEQISKSAGHEDLTANYYNSLGLLYASQHKHREAIRVFQEAMDLDSGCVEAFYNKALSLTAQGRLDEAIDSYTHAIRLRPDFHDAYFNLGNVFKKKGFIEKAIENYLVSVKLKPDFPEAYNNLGLCFKALKRYKQAVESCEKAIELKPDYAEAYNNLGLMLQDQGLWEQAIAAFESAITLKPGHSGAHYNLGYSLNELGEHDDAVMHYRRSIKLKPGFADAHNNLGAILKNQGRMEEAISHYRKALEYSADKAEIYNNLLNALKENGRIDEAIEML